LARNRIDMEHLQESRREKSTTVVERSTDMRASFVETFVRILTATPHNCLGAPSNLRGLGDPASAPRAGRAKTGPQVLIN
jgi:hypothetical protein